MIIIVVEKGDSLEIAEVKSLMKLFGGTAPIEPSLHRRQNKHFTIR